MNSFELIKKENKFLLKSYKKMYKRKKEIYGDKFPEDEWNAVFGLGRKKFAFETDFEYELEQKMYSIELKNNIESKSDLECATNNTKLDIDAESIENFKKHISSILTYESEITEQHNLLCNVRLPYNGGYPRISLDVFNENLIETINEIFNNKNLAYNNKIIYQILVNMPVHLTDKEIIGKENTITEKTKITMFEYGRIYFAEVLIEATLSFEFEFIPDNKKIKNIIFELIGKKLKNYDDDASDKPNDFDIKIPMLKDNPDGYNFVWAHKFIYKN